MSELADAARWYEDRRTGLGSMFLDAVEATVQAVASWPASERESRDWRKRSTFDEHPCLAFPITWLIWSETRRYTSWQSRMTTGGRRTGPAARSRRGALRGRRAGQRDERRERVVPYKVRKCPLS